MSEWYQGSITVASALAAIVINALWQDALLVLCVWLLMRVWPKLNAATRYTVWSATLIAAFIVPVATTLAFFTASPPAATKQISTPLERTHTHRNPLHLAPAHAEPAPQLEIRDAPMLLQAAPRLPGRLRFTLPVPAAVGIFALWLVLAGYALVRLAIGLRRLEQLKRDALPLPVEYRDAMPQWLRANKGARDVRLCVSDETDVPVAVGLFDAMILVPRSLLDRLSEPEVDQICLHELAHLRRADDWTNGIQRVISALLGWNPATQFIGQQLDLEREVACDDWVLSFVGRVRPYALCLTKMAESASWPRHAIPAPGVFATRKHISLRIERLLGAGRNIATNLALGPAAAAVAVVGAIALVIAFVAPSMAAPCVTSFTFVSTGKDEASLPVHVSQAATHVTVPATQVKIPTTEVNVPATHVNVPATHVNVPATHVDVPATHVNVPAMHMTVPATHVSVPGTRVMIPKLAINVPAFDSNKLSNEISQEINHSMNSAYASRSAYSKAVSQAISSSIAQAGSANYGGRTCSGCDYRRVDWSGRDLRGVNYQGVDLTGSKLVGTDFTAGSFNGVDFTRADLRNASFRNARLVGCDFSEADLTGVDFSGARINGCQFTRARLTSSELRDVLNTCNGCDFTRAQLSGLNLSNVRASGDDFSQADLRGVNFAGAQLTGMDFSKAHLDGANLAGATLNGCDLSGVDLTHVDLSKTKLIGMDLSNDRSPEP